MRSLSPPEAAQAASGSACLICCGPADHRFAHCFACRTVARLLNLPLSPVLPALLCPTPGPLYRVLMGYKESSIDEARGYFSERLRRLFAAFFDDHLACVTTALGGGIDLVVPVPSSSRPGRASLEGAAGLDAVVALALGPGAPWRPAALRRVEGEIGHMQPNARAFAVPLSSHATVHGARVILLDDLYVSGSRAQSAAASLRLAGARTVLIVPLGRVLHPERFRTHATFTGAAVTGNGHRPRCVTDQTGAGKG